ncbi:thioredoxin-like protein [Syncephalastrum racemosum]|uniref:Thioredoxin n=1 Tax=Syncephalastrum racemosum TaxID=13706 RepID=A0A1X2HAD5_SYNRA|nr:thioredoxin-like protein [Syncephalastrum racemosum]
MHEIKDAKELEKLITSNKVAFVEFSATWCGPCRMIGPKFKELAEEYPDFTCIKVDVEDAPDIAREYAITSLPTFIIFVNGRQTGDLTGANLEKLREKFEQFKSA